MDGCDGFSHKAQEMEGFLCNLFLDAVCYLSIAVFLPLSAAPIKCPTNTFWNGAIEGCDSCSIYCYSNEPSYLNVCQRNCAALYGQLMNTTTSTLSQTTLSSTSHTILHTVTSPTVAYENETLSTTTFLSTATPDIIGIGAIIIIIVISIIVIVICIKRRDNKRSVTLSCLGGSNETFSTPVQVEATEARSQDLGSLSNSQSISSTEETQPLNGPEASEELVV